MNATPKSDLTAEWTRKIYTAPHTQENAHDRREREEKHTTDGRWRTSATDARRLSNGPRQLRRRCERKTGGARLLQAAAPPLFAAHNPFFSPVSFYV